MIEGYADYISLIIKMDALVLGGGYGTRLFGKYNKKIYCPKGLVQIRGKPCIEHILESFSSNLLDRIIIETNMENEPFYKNWSNNYKLKDKIEIYIEKFSTPRKCLGVLKTIEIVFKHYKFNKPVLIISPDNIFTKNQDEFIKNYNGGARIAVYKVGSRNDAKKYGVVKIESNKIIKCIEKPLFPSSKFIRTSCEIWNEEVFSFLPEWNHNFDSNQVGNFIDFLIHKGIEVEPYKIKGKWVDVGNQQDLNYARSMEFEK